MATCILSCGFNSLHNKKLQCQRFDLFSFKPSFYKPPDNGSFFPVNRSYLLSGSRTSHRLNRSKMEFIVYSGDQVGDLLPFGINLPESWPTWILGVVLAIVLPFFTNKWGPFAKFKDELDEVEEAVDNVADRVVEIAEKVERVVEDIADDLPESSQLKQNLEKIENVVDTIGKDAQLVSDMVDKMDEMEAKVESMIDKSTREKKTSS